MAKEIPSVGDLLRKAEITNDEIEAATAAYLKDDGAEPFVFDPGHLIDAAKAIERPSLGSGRDSDAIDPTEL
jgi:hypothetical protein